MNELGIALISVAVGGLLGYGASSFQAWWDRRRLRRSLASFLLSELRAAEITLQHIYAQPTGALAADAFISLQMTSEAVNVFASARGAGGPWRCRRG
jgi:hypothetical protein